MRETKSIILNAALHLFNGEGFVNVRLQHIADEANISVGNLAYHFEKKQDILLQLYQQIESRQKELLNELNIVPLFEHLDFHWDNVYEVQDRYKFFYIDTLEVIRSNATIAEKHQSHVAWEIKQFIQMIQFNISRGSIRELQSQGDIERIANLLWMYESSCLLQELIKGRKHGLTEMKENLWSILRPYFTDLGEQEFQQMKALQLGNSSFG